MPTGVQARILTGKEIRVSLSPLGCGELSVARAGGRPAIAWTSCSDPIFPRLERKDLHEARCPLPPNQIHSMVKWPQPQAGFQLQLWPQLP